MTNVHIEQLTTSIEEVHENDEAFARLFAQHIAAFLKRQEDDARFRRISEDERRLDSVVERQRGPLGQGWTDD